MELEPTLLSFILLFVSWAWAMVVVFRQAFQIRRQNTILNVMFTELIERELKDVFGNGQEKEIHRETNRDDNRTSHER